MRECSARARIAELLRCRQQLDDELAELYNVEMPAAGVAERRKLERIMEMAPIGIAVVYGPEHRYRYVNPAYQAIAGTCNSPMVGRTLAEVFPDLAAKGVIAGMERISASGQPMALRAFETDAGAGGKDLP